MANQVVVRKRPDGGDRSNLVQRTQKISCRKQPSAPPDEQPKYEERDHAANRPAD